MGSVKLAVRPPGHAEGTLKRGRQSHRLETSAAHRSAAMAGGARPDPFRTRKLSRRAPMVLRGQPVGEQGAADRWTALDPYVAGSGAGAPRGIPPRGAPFLFLFLQPRALRGPFFMPRGPAVEGRAPRRLFAGRTGSSVSAAGGRTAPSSRRAPFPRSPSCRRGGACPVGGRGAAPAGPGACGRMPLRTVRPFTEAASRGPLRQGPSRPARAVSPASRAGLSAGPRVSPSYLKGNRRISSRAPAPLR